MRKTIQRVSWACTKCHAGWQQDYETMFEIPYAVTCERCGRITNVVRRGIYEVEDL